MNATSRMRARRHVLSEFCALHHSGDVTRDGGMTSQLAFRTYVLVLRHRHPLLYCPVGKVASTFLARFFLSAKDTHPVRSPYAVSPDRAVRMRGKRSGNAILFSTLAREVAAGGTRERKFLESMRRVLFVRCPFARLWSAYVDKLLFPNPHYWKAWGYPAVTSERPLNLTRRDDDVAMQGGRSRPGGNFSAHCAGQDVTFSQFLRFALRSLRRRDTHVRPVSQQCAPCYVNYDVIGHVETLSRDAMYLAESVLGLDVSRLKAVRWEEEYARDAIREGVRTVFVKRTSEISRCMDTKRAGERLWRVMQIRGIIDEKIPFPSARLDRTPANATVFEEALMSARFQSGAGVKDRLERQRKAALLSAYADVGEDLKSGIRKVYSDDFKMFGFDEVLH